MATYPARPKVIAREKHAPFVCIAKSEKSHEPARRLKATSRTAAPNDFSRASSIPSGRIIAKPSWTK